MVELKLKRRRKDLWREKKHCKNLPLFFPINKTASDSKPFSLFSSYTLAACSIIWKRQKLGSDSSGNTKKCYRGPLFY